MKFCWTTITVKSMEDSLKFYEEVVGLKLTSRFDAGPNTEIAFLGDGETQIELLHNKGTENVDFGKDISVGFETECVDKLIELINERGIEVHSGPFEPNPHIKFFFVEDPNGLKVQFVQNIKSDK